MGRAVAIVVALALSHASAAAAASPYAAIDARGVRVVLARPAARIVTLAPGLAEMVGAAGAGERLVGVSSATDEPPRARALPVVATPGRIDLERLAVLAPDLVLAWRSGNPPRALERLAAQGSAVFVTEPRTLAGLAAIVRSIGALAGTPTIAEAAAREFETALAAIEARSGARPLGVFIEIWPAPMLTVNGAHLVSDIVRRCGGTNVFADAPVLTPHVGIEALVAADPDVIVTSADPADAHWRNARRLVGAVRAGRVVRVDSGPLHRQSFRVIDAVRAMCAGLAAIGG